MIGVRRHLRLGPVEVSRSTSVNAQGRTVSVLYAVEVRSFCLRVTVFR